MENLVLADKVWENLQVEAQRCANHEPILASYMHDVVLSQKSFVHSLSYHLANKLDSPTLRNMVIRELVLDCLKKHPQTVVSAARDLDAIKQRDAAATSYLIPFLYFKGFIALQAYRIAHNLYLNGKIELAMHLQSLISSLFGVDIHPGAKIGSGILIDHATSVVIGETAVVEDDVSILHEVTLGGTGKDSGDRHPKVRRGVLIGAGAKILGNIEIGEYSKVGAGSVVLKSVAPRTTVVGVPAQIVGSISDPVPSFEMNHCLKNVGE